MPLSLPPVPTTEPWARQPGEGTRPYESFRAYLELPRGRRKIAELATQLGRSPRTLERYLNEHDWLARAAAWDDEEDRVARLARLDAIERINREAVQLGDEMMGLVGTNLPKAAKLLARSPHALIEWARMADELRRKGLGVTAGGHAGPDEPGPGPAHQDADVMAYLTPADRLTMQQAALALVMAENRRDAGLPPPGPTVGDDSEPADGELVP